MPVFHAAPFFISTSSGAGGIVDPSERDFSRYDGYLNDLGVIYLSDGQQRKLSRTLPLQPPRTDIGQSEFETRLLFGDFFSQGDFSHGEGQRFYHREGRNEKKYFHAHGFDISEPGKLRHLNDTAEFGDMTSADHLIEFDDLPFCAQGNNVYRGPADPSVPAVVWTSEDPHAGDGPQPVEDLTTNGGHLYAALGTSGIHRRDIAGTWASYNTGTVFLVEWAKDRLMAAAAREIYEITASGALPTALDTLPENWEWTAIWEAGEFVLASAVNSNASLSRIFTYGLNDAGTALERKASTAMPKGDLIYAGVHYLGRTFTGGGRQVFGGELEPILYEVQPLDDGSLQLLLIAHAEMVDAVVTDFETTPDAIVFPWTHEHRGIGLGIFHLPRNAMATFLTPENPLASENVTSVLRYRGMTLFSAGGTWFEKLGIPCPEAIMITSMADWNNVGEKTWDLFEVSHDPLIVGTSIRIDYTKRDVMLEDWEHAFTNTLSGSFGAEERLADLRSRQLAVRITSTGSMGNSPEINSFSVRSTPSPEQTEWELVRTVRLADRDRKDRRARGVLKDPRAVRNQIQGLAYRWVTLYEAGQTWVAYVQGVAEIEPDAVQVSETSGTPEREVYYLELRMIGRRAV